MLTTDQFGNLLTTSGILTNEANVGFEVPEGQSKYLTAGNDVVDLSKWNGSGSVNIGDAFSSDNDKVTVMANALAGAVAKDNLKLTSIENLEIVNSDVKETPVILKGANFKGLEAVKLIGDATILNVSDFTQGVKIDATANADYIIGSDKADTINGGAGNDTIEGKDGDDVLTGGNGADTFVVGTVKAAGVDQILDFSAEDKISFVGGTYRVKELKKFDASTFSTVTYKTLDSVLATFGSGGANETKDGDVVIFSYDGKTYALLATDTGFKEANDALVDITGANVASLTESNFGEAVSLYTYENYDAFVQGAANIPVGEAIIKTMTVTEAGTLALNNDYLAKVANGGIKAITDGNTITVGMTEKPGASEFNASVFDSKLSPNVTGIFMNITDTNTQDTIIASKLGGTITAGSGKDAISLGAGADVVKFTVKDANNENNITNFTVSGTKLDKLSFDTSVFTDLGELTGSDLTEVTTETALNAAATTIYKGTKSNLQTHLKGTSGTFENKVVVAIATDAGNEGIYAATLGASSSTLVKVGTLDDVDLDTLTMANFVAAA